MRKICGTFHEVHPPRYVGMWNFRTMGGIGGPKGMFHFKRKIVAVSILFLAKPVLKFFQVKVDINNHMN